MTGGWRRGIGHNSNLTTPDEFARKPRPDESFDLDKTRKLVIMLQGFGKLVRILSGMSAR